MNGKKTFLYTQRTINGITYTLQVTADLDNPLKKIPAITQFRDQFLDIMKNHGDFVAETIDKEDTLRTAAEQVKEYFSGKPTPLAKVLGA